MSSKSAPPAPDYQGAAGKDTQANRPDQTNAAGATSQWHQGPDGSWTQTSGLGGPLGGAMGAAQGQAAANMAQPFSFSQFGKIDDGSAARDQAISGAYGQATSRLDPQWAQRQEQENAQLANQGLDPSSQASKDSQQAFGQQRNDAYSSAMNGAIQQGTAAQQATFAENMGARQQAISEALQQRGMPMQEIQQLMQLTGQSGFNPSGENLQAAGMAGQYGLGAAQQNGQMWGDIAQGVGSLASMAPMLAMSDERMKQNIERTDAEAIPGVPISAFEYKHDPGVRRVGVIAQDLEKVAPHLVQTGPDGIKRVPAHPPFSFGVRKKP